MVISVPSESDLPLLHRIAGPQAPFQGFGAFEILHCHAVVRAGRVDRGCPLRRLKFCRRAPDQVADLMMIYLPLQRT